MSDQPFLIDGKTPWEFACGWYTPDEIERSIANRHKSGFVRNDIPADIESRAFAEWLCEQYRLAMNKGFMLARSDLTAARAEIERLRAENNKLRYLLAKGSDPCVYCALPAADTGKCRAGFPGCARADDLLCGELDQSQAAARQEG